MPTFPEHDSLRGRRLLRRLRRAAVVTVVLSLISAGVGVTVSGAASAAPPGGTAPAPTTDPVAHDPTLIKQGRFYYEIITGDIATRTYLPIRRSTDLISWTFVGMTFAQAPAWITQELGVTPGDFWAPDISFFGGAYHLYYAASSFGTNNSVIGLATTRTLDPGSPDYGWVDHGMVFRSHTTDNFNAIDPDVVFDTAGVPWMSFGSFWDGIKMRRLDARTGMLSGDDTTLYSLASRGGGAIEAPSILYRDGYYYLFVSFDYCCRGENSDYRVMVGRSTSVTGPYTDRAGVPMMQGGGTELLRGYNGFRGPGHGDVYIDGHTDLFVHHYYDAADAGKPKGSVRRIFWAGGWPSFGDPLSGNRGVGHGSAYFAVVDRSTGAVLKDAGCGYEGADIRTAARAGDDPCQLWRPEYRGDGWSSLLNRWSNKVAEVAACVNADGARVAQWGWLANDCQRFRVVATDNGWSRIENKLAGRVLQPADCAVSAAPVQTFTWAGGTCQQFRLDPVGDTLIADAAGERVLDVVGCGRTRAGSAPVAAGRRDSDCQLWRFDPVTEGFYRIVDVASGRSLAMRGSRLVVGRHPGTDRRPSSASRRRLTAPIGWSAGTAGPCN